MAAVAKSNGEDEALRGSAADTASKLAWYVLLGEYRELLLQYCHGWAAAGGEAERRTTATAITTTAMAFLVGD
jgi:hypothetical protein